MVLVSVVLFSGMKGMILIVLMCGCCLFCLCILMCSSVIVMFVSIVCMIVDLLLVSVNMLCVWLMLVVWLRSVVLVMFDIVVVIFVRVLVLLFLLILGIYLMSWSMVIDRSLVGCGCFYSCFNLGWIFCSCGFGVVFILLSEGYGFDVLKVKVDGIVEIEVMYVVVSFYL